MKYFLFPSWCQPIGWALLLAGLGIEICYLSDVFDVNGWLETGLFDFFIISMILSAVLIIGSRRKTEDEFTIAVRLKSILYSLYILTVITIIGCLVFSNLEFIIFLLAMLPGCPIVFIICYRIIEKRNELMFGKEE